MTLDDLLEGFTLWTRERDNLSSAALKKIYKNRPTFLIMYRPSCEILYVEPRSAVSGAMKVTEGRLPTPTDLRLSRLGFNETRPGDDGYDTLHALYLARLAEFGTTPSQRIKDPEWKPRTFWFLSNEVG